MMTEIQLAQSAIDEFLSQKIAKTIEQKQKKDKDKFTPDDEQKIRETYQAKTWLNTVVENIDKVFINVSHIAKLTHSSSQAMNARDNIPQTQNLHLITTQTANATILDKGYADAKLSPVAEFLTYPIENSDKALGELLCEHEQCFARISDDINERQSWSDTIKGAYVAKKLSTHTLAKQIYIPINNNGDYHLISPMYSSSLAQHIFEYIKNAHDKDNPAKIAKQKNEFHQDETIYFPNIATLGITKSNHQNVSILNGKRSGQLYLFSALPPKIKTNPLPPKNINSLLKNCYLKCKNDLKEIKSLIHIIKQNELFLNDDRKQLLIEYVQNITENVLDEMIIIRQNQNPNWTDELAMPMYLKLFLDSGILENQTFSQPEYQAHLTELANELAKWISDNSYKTRSVALEKLWVKIIMPILQSHYLLFKSA